MSNRLPSDATRDKQILAFCRRADVFRAAEAVASARMLGCVEAERLAINKLVAAVHAYQNRKTKNPLAGA